MDKLEEVKSDESAQGYGMQVWTPPQSSELRGGQPEGGHRLRHLSLVLEEQTKEAKYDVLKARILELMEGRLTVEAAMVNLKAREAAIHELSGPRNSKGNEAIEAKQTKA